MSIHRIAVVMPAYNEQDGIAGFLAEIREHLAPLCDELRIVVADDRSTDDTAAAASRVDGVDVQTQAANRGHGPTALAAYRAGLALEPDLVLHVDGDGQFTGRDMARMVAASVSTEADVVHGVRRDRTDPWFRRALTAALRVAIAPVAGRAIPDINTPLRAYRPEALRILLDALGPDAEVPHVHFSLAEARGGFVVRYLEVTSIPRRGDTASGTMWGAVAAPKLPPKRLRAFVRRALRELWAVSLAPAARMRGLAAPVPGVVPQPQATADAAGAVSNAAAVSDAVDVSDAAAVSGAAAVSDAADPTHPNRERTLDGRDDG